jgi:Domain of unknown function (DUF4157)
MAGQVIQGFFIGGTSPAMARSVQPRAVQPAITAPRPGPPGLASAGAATKIQAKPAPGRPPVVHGAPQIFQPSGGNGSFEIDPVQIGLARGGGKPLPQAVLAKMEGAFGADFSGVRVHVGPQAARIGAVAFTTGNDLYFAPGQFQPESVKGQQLIGHELAHVIQQRQGRVRAPGSGVAVVQDRALEAEADRLGMRAASLMTRPGAALLPKLAPRFPPLVGAVLQPSKFFRSASSSSDSSSDEDESDDGDSASGSDNDDLGFDFGPSIPAARGASPRRIDDRIGRMLDDFESCLTDEMMQRHIMHAGVPAARAVARQRYLRQRVERSTSLLMDDADRAAFLDEIRRKNRNGSFSDANPGVQTSDRAYHYFDRDNVTGFERTGRAHFQYNVISNGPVKIFGHFIRLVGVGAIAPAIVLSMAPARVARPALRVGGRRFARRR